MSYEIRSQGNYTDHFFRGINLEQAQLVASEFYDCTFIGCAFAGCVFRTCKFITCIFQQCDLSLVQVPGSTFSATRFEESKLVGVDWTRGDWAATRLGDPIGFFNCTISHSTFIGLSLPEIRIRDCVAADVDFRETNLSGADFRGTDLSDSLFSNTNLAEADLSTARNYHIAPEKNVLKRAKFSLPEAMSLLYNLDIDLIDADSY